MTEKKTQRAWEQRLLQQQEDLDRREALLSSLEKKYSVMQGRADEFQRSDAALRLREDRVSEIEFKESSLLEMERELRIQKAEVEKELQLQRRLTEKLMERIDIFESERQAREDDLRQRQSEVQARETRLTAEKSLSNVNFDQQRQHLRERENEVAVLEAEIKLRKVSLSEEHSQIQRWQLDLRNKEEEHDTYEKLMKDMQLADERSKKSLKFQEDELQRRLAELKIQREDQAAENAALTVLKERIERDKRLTERQLQDIANEDAETERRTQRLARQEADLTKKREEVHREENRLALMKKDLDMREKQVHLEATELSSLRRETEIDVKRATHLRLKSTVQETSNTAVQKKLTEKEKQLSEWDSELDWRETEFVRSVEAAMNWSHEVPDFSPSHVNKAILDLQMDQMKQSYNAAAHRRVVSALQPQNRVKSAGNSRAALPLRNSRPSTAGEIRDIDIMAKSHRSALDERSVVLERDFRHLIGKVARLQANSTTDEQRHAILGEYFTAGEQATIRLALHRNRDLGAEVAMRRVVAECPISNPVGTPQELVERMKLWWKDLDSHLTARSEVIVHDRVDLLEEAVEILRAKCPLFANSSTNRNESSSRK